MRKVIVNEFMSLDGVAQAPGAADEDTTGSFQYGGWHMRYFDDISQKQVLESIVEAGGFLLGRRTYEIFAGYWPNAPEVEQVIAEPLNTKPKYVTSTTLTEPLEWQNSTLLQGDVAEAGGRAAAGGRRGREHDRPHGAGPDVDRARRRRRVPTDDRPGRPGWR
jgi:dihydrofolate reductase